MALQAPICTGGAWPGASPPAAACRKGMLSSLLSASDSLHSTNQSINQTIHQTVTQSTDQFINHDSLWFGVGPEHHGKAVNMTSLPVSRRVSPEDRPWTLHMHCTTSVVQCQALNG